MLNELICAFGTAAGTAAIAVLRISGAGAAKAADLMFRFGPLPKELKQFESSDYALATTFEVTNDSAKAANLTTLKTNLLAANIEPASSQASRPASAIASTPAKALNGLNVKTNSSKMRTVQSLKGYQAAYILPINS